MSKSDKHNKPKEFSLWCNEKNHKFNTDTFARVSKKCASLVHANDYQGAITHPVSPEAFNAFSLACHLKPFKVTLTNAFELLDLAQEWGIPSLENFVGKYIHQKGLKRQEEDDHLAKLLAKAEDVKSDISNEVAGIARNFNEFLIDERLARVHPEHLFKILMQAENRRINMQLLIDFVMKLIENEPEKAVPLCLRLDFDKVSEHQNEEIFQCREMHEQAMGYFIAEALSTLRNKAQDELTNVEQRYIKEIQDIKDTLTKQRNEQLDAVNEEFEKETKEIEDLIKKQQKQIDQLRQLRDKHRKMAKEEEARFEETMNGFKDDLEKQLEIKDNLQKLEEARRAKIRKLVSEMVVPIQNTVSQRCDEITRDDNHRRDLFQKDIFEWRERYLHNYEEIKAQINKIDLDIQYIQKRVSETRGTIAAKIITDQLRHDSFLRRIEKRFEVFNTEPGFWNLTPEQVEESEVIVKKLENRVRSSCPLNVDHHIASSADAIQKFADVFKPKKEV